MLISYCTGSYVLSHGCPHNADLLQAAAQVPLINIYCVAGYFDNVQNVIGGALRGVGINQAPAVVYLICSWDAPVKQLVHRKISGRLITTICTHEPWLTIGPCLPV